MSDIGYSDGNLLAGPLSDLFAVDLTIATTACSGCGKVDRVAALHVYVVGEGYVARCPGCGDAVLRLLRTPSQVVLDLRGTFSLRVPVTETAP